MKPQNAFSLAIQALHERRSRLQTMNNGLIEAGQYAKSIKECEEAIQFMEGLNGLDIVLSACGCPVKINLVQKDCGNKIESRQG